MNYKLCAKADEIIDFMANFHKVDVEFLLDQLMIVSISLLLSDASYRTPDRKFTFFEDNEMPCDTGETIDDHYSWFEEIREKLSVRYGFSLPKQLNIFEERTTDWSQAKDIAIDCLQDAAA